MAIASTIKEGATAVAATGGTDVTLSSLGIQDNKNTLIFSTDTAMVTRRLVEFSVKPYQPSSTAPGGYTQNRETILFKQPKVLANGERTINTLKIELSTDPETTDAEVEQMCETGAQMLGTSAFLPFFKTQNLT
jgi:hypothetical protein